MVDEPYAIDADDGGSIDIFPHEDAPDDEED